MFKLVVGLGNPGARYDDTPHNIGFAVIDELARRAAIGLVEQEREFGVIGRLPDGTRLLKPTTFMNASGEAVRHWVNWLKIPPSEVLIIVDDVALPLGQLRLRADGTHGGHNGLRSIEKELGTTRVPRLRCGVGPVPERWAMEDYVLARFQESQRGGVADLIKKAADAFQYCQTHGLSLAMTLFNTKPKQNLESSTS